MAEKKQQVPVRLAPELRKRLNDYAEHSGLKKQTILQRAIEEYLDARERAQRRKKRGA